MHTYTKFELIIDMFYASMLPVVDPTALPAELRRLAASASAAAAAAIAI